jgi:hypothetical protein
MAFQKARDVCLRIRATSVIPGHSYLQCF